jgi:hypothetical protein
MKRGTILDSSSCCDLYRKIGGSIPPRAPRQDMLTAARSALKYLFCCGLRSFMCGTRFLFVVEVSYT